LILYLAN